MGLTGNDYLIHYGVKGMKWGVRHDQPSVGRRYSNWGKKTSNKMYDKMSSNVEARRQKNKQENWAKNSKNKTVARYGNWVDRTSDKVYDKKNQKIEDRRQRKMQEFGEFDRMLDAKDNAVKSFNEKAKSLKLTPEQKKTAKKIAIGAAVVAGVGLAAYGGYKVSSIRSINRAAIGKFLSRAENSDIKASVLGGDWVKYSNPTRTHTAFNGIAEKGSTVVNGKITKSIKGPTLNATRSTVQKYKPGTTANPMTSSKLLEKYSVGAGGRNNPATMTKLERQYYDKLYRYYTTGNFKYKKQSELISTKALKKKKPILSTRY